MSARNKSPEPMPASPPLEFKYSIKRGRRKTLGIYIKDATVEVRVPYFTSHDDVHPWVIEKADWIRQQLHKQHIETSQKPDIRDGGCILFLGRERKLRFSSGTATVFEDNEDIHVTAQTEASLKEHLEKWLKKEAKSYLQERVFELADLMNETENICHIQYRKTRSKWGHCTSEGILQFNWLIIMAPPDVIDYLIIHEISHLKQMNHSHAFWQRVASFCPDYKIHRNWLKKHGHRIWI